MNERIQQLVEQARNSAAVTIQAKMFAYNDLAEMLSEYEQVFAETLADLVINDCLFLMHQLRQTAASKSGAAEHEAKAAGYEMSLVDGEQTIRSHFGLL